MHSDDVFRAQLNEVITSLKSWSEEHRDCADTKITSRTGFYWKMEITPHFPGACPFQVLLLATPQFSLDIAGEVYEDKPVGRFDFFPMLARAIAAGDVERHDRLSAMTGALDAVEMRVSLEDGWVWIGERRAGGRGTRKFEAAQETKIKRFLPYRR